MAKLPTTPTPPVLPDSGFIRLKQLMAFVPMSCSTVWRQVKSGTFPAPVKLSKQITAWRVADIREWINRTGALA